MIRQTLHKLTGALALTSILTLAACGGGGGGGGSSGGSLGLNGTWRGNLEDPSSVMHTMSVTISDDQITAISNDGTDQGLTGTITRESSNVYSFELSDGTVGGFIADDGLEHAAFVDDDFNIGALQKNAGGLPAFSQGDIAVSAIGLTVTTDFNTFQEFDSSVSCDSGGNCAGSDTLNGNFSGILTLDDPLGRWSGTFVNGNGDSLSTAVFLTADKQAAAAWSCNFAAGGFPDFCAFSGWVAN